MSDTPPRITRYRGLSMWPYFQEGDLLEVVPATIERVGLGDCVVLRAADGTLIAHRVVGLRHGLRTRGDARSRDDDRKEAGLQLTGRIVARHRLGRRSAVTGGRRGWLLGKFLYVAGRVDPQRRGRGGKAGRVVRAVCAPLTGPIVRKLSRCPERMAGSLAVAAVYPGHRLIQKLTVAVAAVKASACGRTANGTIRRLGLATGIALDRTATAGRGSGGAVESVNRRQLFDGTHDRLLPLAFFRHRHTPVGTKLCLF
jgi:hypothetical protein